MLLKIIIGAALVVICLIFWVVGLIDRDLDKPDGGKIVKKVKGWE